MPSVDALTMPVAKDQSVLQPGSTIGVLGGGQLARMFAFAAHQMGYHVIPFSDVDNAPAVQVCQQAIIAEYDDEAALRKFASLVDVVTLEFENIPAESVALLQSLTLVRPSAQILAVSQHRVNEKEFLVNSGVAVAPFKVVAQLTELKDAVETLSLPVIIKTAAQGYDGKGQQKLKTTAEVEELLANNAEQSLGALPWVVEQFIPFEREVSVLVSRNASGACQCSPVFENEHQNHILHITRLPATASVALQAEAEKVAKTIAEKLDLMGLLCVEFFVVNNTVVVNEIAPRPHNSGHIATEACQVSQFEQAVRAVCNLPLMSMSPSSPYAAMLNILGWPEGQEPDWSAITALPNVSLHLYGKAHAVTGRKMGHISVVASSLEERESTLKQLQQLMV